jgi:hypothetical protein
LSMPTTTLNYLIGQEVINLIHYGTVMIYPNPPSRICNSQGAEEIVSQSGYLKAVVKRSNINLISIYGICLFTP